MKNFSFTKSVVAGIIAIFCFQSVGATVADTTLRYPYAVFSSNVPQAGQKISIQWYIGMYKDACVPAFETTVTKTIRNGIISFNLVYKEVEVQDERACIQVLTPYGPKFEVGPFEAGHEYRIYIDTVLIRSFSIAKSKFPYAVVTPQEPKAGDNVSVRWILGEDSVNCVMQYSTEIKETSILKSNPPIHVVSVDYREKPVQYLTCLSRPTLYGPEFDLGIVEAGDYTMYYGSAVVAKFTVASAGEYKPVMNVTPEQPFEGDTVKVKLVLGRGSSSCAPRFVPHFDRTLRDTGVYEYKLTYETIENNTTIPCTEDYVPYGPEWIFTDLKAGTHIFNYSGTEYYKVFVQKKRQIPEFAYATITGTVYDMRKAVDTTGNDIRAAVVSQCTVMVVFENIIIATKSTAYQDSITNSKKEMIVLDTSVAPSQITFMAVTSETGEYRMENVPVSLLLNRSYTIAKKNNFVGYGTIPDVLTKEIVSNITLYKLEAFIDSVRVILDGTEEVVSLLKQLGIKGSSGVKKPTVSVVNNTKIYAVAGGFRVENQSGQLMQIAVFTLNGKRIWQQNATYLTEGEHFFAVPKIGNGVYLLKVQSEKFVQSQIMSVGQR